MNNIEFDIIDELYFVQPFAYLVKNLEYSEQEIKTTLQQLISKGWVKCYSSEATGVPLAEFDFDNRYNEYSYLASKAGLLAHNTR